MPASGTPGIGHGFDTDQPWPERAGRHKQRRRAAQTFLCQIEHPPGPRKRPASRVVDGDPRTPGLVGRQHLGEDIEQLCRRCRVALRELNRRARRDHAGGHCAEGLGAAVELAAEFGLDASQRFVVGRSEPAELEGSTGGGGDDGAEQSADDESSG